MRCVLGWCIGNIGHRLGLPSVAGQAIFCVVLAQYGATSRGALYKYIYIYIYSTQGRPVAGCDGNSGRVLRRKNAKHLIHFYHISLSKHVFTLCVLKAGAVLGQFSQDRGSIWGRSGVARLSMCISVCVVVVYCFPYRYMCLPLLI